MRKKIKIYWNESPVSGYGAAIISLLLVICISVSANAQITVSSLSELKPYLDDDNVDVKLEPGTYTINADAIANDEWGYAVTYFNGYSRAVMLFEGNNSTYDFTDVTINFDTDLFTAFGSYQVWEIQIIGNNNILKNLTMVDDGSEYDAPSVGVTNIVMDGEANRIEGFHVTVKGSEPYGYGDAFGKGGSYTIQHFKHSACLVRGESNHVLNCTFIQRAYGHCVFMQAARNPIIEGCYIEGEVRTTDDMLAEEGTGSAADEIDFLTDWGYTLPAGYMMSLAEEGIRAYNAGESVINGEYYAEEATSNPTVLNCTVVRMRGGITLPHASGPQYVSGCTVRECQGGYSIDQGSIVDSSADCVYGPVYKNAYDADSPESIEIEILPGETSYYNGPKAVAYFGIDDSDVVLTGGDDNLPSDLRIQLGGFYDGVGLQEGNASSQNNHGSVNLNIQNLTESPIEISESSSGATGQSCGTITDPDSDNDITPVENCEEACILESDVNVPNGLEAGLSYRYYEGTWNEMPDFSSLTAVESGMVTGVDISSAAVDNFAFVFDGYINLTSDGKHNFYIASDDYSRLVVDDVEVISNDGKQEVDEKTVELCLEAGYHSFLLEYYEQGSTKSLSVSYDGPDFSKKTLDNVFAKAFVDSDNIALNGIATQSSTSFDGDAWRAIDGDTNGVFSAESVTHTEADDNAWWQVDLGETVNVGTIKVFNRTDCCTTRLSDFTVSVLDADENVSFSEFFSDSPEPSIEIDAFGAEGRIVRVQLDAAVALSLAEVEVYEASSLPIVSEIQEGDVGFCSIDGTVDTTLEGYTGDGYLNSDVGRGKAATWKVSGPAGAYILTWRYSTESEATARFEVDEEEIFEDDFVFSATSDSWGDYVTGTVIIPEPFDSLELISTSVNGLPDIDYFEIKGYDYSLEICEAEIEEVLSTENLETSTTVEFYPSPISDRLSVVAPQGQYQKYQVLSLSGVVVLQGSLSADSNKTFIDFQNVNRGIYLVALSGYVDRQVFRVRY